ncbi:hypothetical protein MHK_009766 [Candidatus Magnetomorum sp. HK-1]|nr:hypothetical protein MHK_009766 [Candidatus Magnetomorum sp. HK-1]
MNMELLQQAIEMPPIEKVAFAEMILASVEHEDKEITFPKSRTFFI